MSTTRRAPLKLAYDRTRGHILQTDPVGYEDDLNLYQYVRNDPLNNTDPTGRIVDTIADVVFIVVDLGVLAHDELTTGGANRTENLLALGADAAGAVVPFATGGGLAVRAANRADDLADAARATCCFVAGTLVETNEGLRPIEEIEVGDLVLSRDEETGETAYKPVTDLIRRHQRIIWEVVLTGSDGERARFETTDDHPWWIAGVGWRRTEELTTGMAVVTADGRGMVITSVMETERTANTYNLTVADFETYFVGEQRVLVHNCPAGGRSPEAAERAARNVERGIPESQLGGSGHPRQHTVRHSSRHDARETGERATPPGGRTRHDASPANPNQGPHYQAEDADGVNVHPTVHHEYPRRR